MMGSEEYEWEKPVHKVTISKPFYLGVYPVTQQEWKAIMKNNPSNFEGENLPVEQVSWYDSNSGSKTHPVGQKKPNPWFLYDMHGNVWEWVQDKWHSNYNGAPTDGISWEGDGSDRVLRGGRWNRNARYCRSAGRYFYDAGSRSYDIGFRLLRIS